MSYLVKDKRKFYNAMRELGLENTIDLDGITTISELFLRIEVSERKTEIIEKVIKSLILKRLMKIAKGESITLAMNQRPEDATEPLLNKLNKKETLLIKRAILKSTNWRLPTTVLSKGSFRTNILVLIIWASLLFIFFKNKVDFLIVTFNVFSIVFLLFLALLPGIILTIVAPNIFYRHEFYQIILLEDFINELYRLNEHQYLKDDFSLTKEEIFDLFGSFQGQSNNITESSQQ